MWLVICPIELFYHLLDLWRHFRPRWRLVSWPLLSWRPRRMPRASLTSSKSSSEMNYVDIHDAKPRSIVVLFVCWFFSTKFLSYFLDLSDCAHLNRVQREATVAIRNQLHAVTVKIFPTPESILFHFLNKVLFQKHWICRSKRRRKNHNYKRKKKHQSEWNEAPPVSPKRVTRPVLWRHKFTWLTISFD